MKLNCKQLVFIPGVIKRIILTGLIIPLTILNVHAQLSGLNIASSAEVTTDPRVAGVTIKGIEKSTAMLRKLFNEEKKQQIIAAKDPITISKEGSVPVKELNKSPSLKDMTAPVVTISGTTYDIPGSTSLHQYTSLQANFKFVYDMHGLSPQQYSSFNVTQAIELYKLEKGGSVRSFCIPSGSCSSVNIPIQITGNGLRNGPATGAATGKGPGGPCFTVIVPSGYLQPGEYVFIDKSSLTADGSSLICFAFTVKQ